MAITLSSLTLTGQVNAKRVSNVAYTTFLTTAAWTGQATFSNSNLTADIVGNGLVRSAASTSTGLKYWEITLTSWAGAFAPIVGIAVAANVSAPAGVIANRSNTLYSWWGGANVSGSPSPQFYGSREGISYGSRMSFGDRIGVLLDNTANTLTFYRNGVSQGVAYTNLPDVEYVAWVQSAGNGLTVRTTANFGETPFAFPVAGATGLFTPV